MHYKFNTRIDNAFWKACWNDTDLADAEEIVDYYENCGPGLMWASEAMGPADPFGWEGISSCWWGNRCRAKSPGRVHLQTNSCGRPIETSSINGPPRQ